MFLLRIELKNAKELLILIGYLLNDSFNDQNTDNDCMLTDWILQTYSLQSRKEKK